MIEKQVIRGSHIINQLSSLRRFKTNIKSNPQIKDLDYTLILTEATQTFICFEHSDHIMVLINALILKLETELDNL